MRARAITSKTVKLCKIQKLKWLILPILTQKTPTLVLAKLCIYTSFAFDILLFVSPSYNSLALLHH